VVHSAEFTNHPKPRVVWGEKRNPKDFFLLKKEVNITPFETDLNLIQVELDAPKDN